MTVFDYRARLFPSPDESLARLVEGNARFVAGVCADRDVRSSVSLTSMEQHPFAAVLTCIDSRVSPELLFDQGVGDLLCLRVPGNVVSDDVLGGLEYACEHAGSRLIVVLGHSDCGAIKGACDGHGSEHLAHALGCIAPAVEFISSRVSAMDCSSKNDAFVTQVAEANLDLAVQAVRAGSRSLRALEASGSIAIVGGMYDVSTGKVRFREANGWCS